MVLAFASKLKPRTILSDVLADCVVRISRSSVLRQESISKQNLNTVRDVCPRMHREYRAIPQWLVWPISVEMIKNCSHQGTVQPFSGQGFSNAASTQPITALNMHALIRWFTRFRSGDIVVVSQVGPHDPYARDPYWTLIEHRRIWIWPLLVLCIAMFAALPIDIALSKWFLQERAPHFVHKLTSVTEPFGNGIGVMIICCTIFLLDKTRRRDLIFVAASSLGAGLVANLVKMSIVRVRPYAYSFDGTVRETFGPWLESTAFPSGHTTTAVGLAMALGLLYPRARGLFIALAVSVGVYRVCVGAHFLSDVFAGAALGYVVGLVCCRAHLGKWRKLGAITTTATDGSPCVTHTPIEFAHARISRSSSDVSEQVVRDESFESAAS